MLWQKNSMFLRSIIMTECVCVYLWMSLQRPHSPKESQKETHCLWMFLYESGYIPLASLCSTVSLFTFWALSWIKPWERHVTHGGILWRGHSFTQSVFIPEKHFAEMKSVIKLRRTSARDAPGEHWEELFFPSVGCFSIGWQRCVHLCLERRLTLSVTGAKDRMWETWGETSQFLLSLKRILS